MKNVLFLYRPKFNACLFPLHLPMKDAEQRPHLNITNIFFDIVLTS
jgi:hypothetical protein